MVFQNGQKMSASTKVICLSCRAYKKHSTTKCPHINCNYEHDAKECTKSGYFPSSKNGEVTNKNQEYQELTCADADPVFQNNMNFIKQLLKPIDKVQ